LKVALLARPDHSVALYRGLAKLGVEVDYRTFYAFREGTLWNRLLPNRKTIPHDAHTSVAFTLLGYPIATVGRRFDWNWRKIERAVARLVLRASDLDSADVIHYWPFFFDHLVARMQKRSRAVTIADYYEAEPSFVNALYRNAYDTAGIAFQRPVNELIDQNAAFSYEENFVVSSEYAKRSYVRRFPEARIHIVSYGLLGARPRLRQSPRPRTKWVFVGSVSLEKGVHVLLEAMSRQPQATLDLIGPINEAQRSYFEARSRGLSNVHFRGPLRHVEVLAALDRYQAFVLPSLSDAYSLAVIEAIVAGLPVVVSENCGNADDVRKFDLGAVTPVGDAEALAETMNHVGAKLDEEQLLEGARRFDALEQNSPYAARVLALYRQLLSERI
jgi:glycosyltransferase involved in cell wall biosynthesis